ncbi:hypothetical protein [Peptostreptococcus equinus]|uniref:YopA central domain-containing protein n=1 Tax=Peptostreptococcus equinus TaxID=3003601 RepID=A0ABY7JU93_9FIRM|nr:hypothetical protein [Peptostreptococcus sp. CBA3647]WAW15728.1 hypothetical protein O0R46_04560 [Peptostreptococcus sp. CBA3647]
MENIVSNNDNYKINEDLLIYKGKFCLYTNSIIKCTGSIMQKITDPMSIYFTGQIEAEQNIEQLEGLFYDNVELEIVGYKMIDAQIVSIRNNIIYGYVNDRIIKSKDTQVDYIKFDIVNMDKIPARLVDGKNGLYAGRIEFELNDYKITIDKNYNFNKYLKEELIRHSASAITHTGIINRIDNKPFKTKKIDSILERTSLALTFAAGRYVSISNAYGYENEKEIYRSWYIMDTSEYKFVFNWTSTISNFYNFEKYLTLMCKKLEEVYYFDIVASILDWYIEAVNGLNIRNNIITIQTALEMLSYIVLVENENIYSDLEYDLHPSNQNIRKLLEICKIDYSIPGVLNLNKSITNKYKDSVDLITYFRNTVVHPSKSKRNLEFEFEDMWNITLIGINFIELILLYMINYKGEYSNRFESYFFGDVSLVPWNSKINPKSK